MRLPALARERYQGLQVQLPWCLRNLLQARPIPLDSGCNSIRPRSARTTSTTVDRRFR